MSKVIYPIQRADFEKIFGLEISGPGIYVSGVEQISNEKEIRIEVQEHLFNSKIFIAHALDSWLWGHYCFVVVENLFTMQPETTLEEALCTR